MADVLAARIVAMARAAEQVDAQRMEYFVLDVGVEGASAPICAAFVNNRPRGRVSVRTHDEPTRGTLLQGMLNDGWRIEVIVPGSKVTLVHCAAVASRLQCDRRDLSDDECDVKVGVLERSEIAATSYVILKRLRPLA